MIINSRTIIKKILLIISLVIIALLIILGIWIYYEIKVPFSKSSDNIFFEVKDGQSTLEIAKNLENQKIIRNSCFFALYVRFKKDNLLPGLYYLNQKMNLKSILQQLSLGKVQEYKITIPEGWTNKQIADYLVKKEIVTKDDFLAAANGKEGYLFPDTYRLSVKTDSVGIVQKMMDNFQTRTKGLAITNNAIIMASILEREAKTYEDKQIIAGIYESRLKLGMFLESCPTVLYAMGVIKDQLSLEDLKFVSPYNTYLHKGLPPGPISNPGLESIKAALDPTDSNYLFFLSDKDGNIHYAKNLAEHNANKQKYL